MTCDNLVKLPTEVLQKIFTDLMGIELQSLSLVCHRIYDVVFRQLFSAVVVRPESEDLVYRLPNARELPDKVVKTATALHFRTSFKFSIPQRCVRGLRKSSEVRQEDRWPFAGCTSPTSHNHSTPCNCFIKTPKTVLEESTSAFLSLFADKRLLSFSWEMGTCFPDSAMKFVENMHTSLRAFTISCHLEESLIQDGSYAVLNNVQTLVIRGDSMYRLALLMCPPASQTLRSLEYDPLEWFGDSDLELMRETEEDQTSMWQGWATPNTTHLYANLRSLSLSNVVIHPVIANSTSLSSLSSLTLRSCPGWRDLLAVILDGDQALSLTTFELIESEFRTYPPDPDGGRYAILCDFLSEIPGLERLFLGLRAPALLVGLTTTIHEHQATLKRLVLHERLEGHAWSDHLPSILDLKYPVGTLREFFSSGNFLHLEAVGYSCELKYIKIFDPSLNLPNIRLIHIRRTAGDVLFGIRDDDSLDFEYGVEDIHPTFEKRHDGYMSEEIQELLATAFWNECSSALEAIVFGDFAHGEWRGPNNNFVALRDRDHISGRGYKLVRSSDIKYRRLFEDYGDVMAACPMSRLM